MDAKRLEVVKTLTEVLEISLKEGGPSRRMSRVIEHRLDWLIKAENSALKQMEKHRAKPSTGDNYAKAEEARDRLDNAVQAMLDGDEEEALLQLRHVAEPPEPVAAAPVRKATRKRVSK